MIKNLLKKLGYVKKPNHTGRDKRRSFTSTQKKHIWYQQNEKCAHCPKKLDLRTVQYDHITRWADGGETMINNCEALCPDCHCRKTFGENLNYIEEKL